LSDIDFKIYKNQNIITNHREFVHDCHLAHEKFKNFFKDQDSTWSYNSYNIFGLTSPKIIWYNLYRDLSSIVKDYVNTNDPLWLQCWMNYHYSNKVLNWHGHNFPIHGWINIDPKNTKTIFRYYKEKNDDRDYEIYNSVGNIYIGPGHRWHKVVVESDFLQPRITLGFNVLHSPPDVVDVGMSFIPIV